MTAADIKDSYTSFHVKFGHDCRRRGKGLQHKVLGFQATLVHGPVDISNGVPVACNDMKIGTHFYAVVADRIGNILNVIYRKFLGYHINDLVAGRNKSLFLVIY